MLFSCEIIKILICNKKRIVNLTKSIWPKFGFNMTETDKPYLFEHDRKVTMTNVIFGHFQPFMFVVVAIFIKFFGHVQQINVFRHVQRFPSYWFGPENNPQRKIYFNFKYGIYIGFIMSNLTWHKSIFLWDVIQFYLQSKYKYDVPLPY